MIAWTHFRYGSLKFWKAKLTGNDYAYLFRKNGRWSLRGKVGGRRLKENGLSFSEGRAMV